MSVNNLKQLLGQYRVAVVGCPDSGKSTFISTLVKSITGRELSTDTLMKEVHWSDGRDPYGNPDTRTIKCAKIMFKYEDEEYCFYDCPGHLEYIGQIKQGTTSADIVIRIHDSKNKEVSDAYLDNISYLLKNKITLDLHSHSDRTLIASMEYDTEDKEHITGFMKTLMPYIRNSCFISGGPHDIELEAVEHVKECVDPEKKNVLLFSGGKDSVAGLFLLSKAGLLDNVEVKFPYSGYDFKEVYETNELIKKFFEIEINDFSNSGGKTYEKDGAYAMLAEKAKANEDLVAREGIDMLLIQFRASDEGVRSKDYHIADRGTHKRFSSVFYFSESNIWRLINKYNLPVNPLYLKGYRSLGDAPVTEPCMPVLESIDKIIEYIDAHPETTERDGRKKQDSSVDFAMEKLRNVGFF